MINLMNKEDHNKSGIYMITNLVNGKYYIGVTEAKAIAVAINKGKV